MSAPNAEYLCVHSKMQDDCLGCLHGFIRRDRAYIARLRGMVEPSALAVHDMEWFGHLLPPIDGSGAPQ